MGYGFEKSYLLLNGGGGGLKICQNHPCVINKWPLLRYSLIFLWFVNQKRKNCVQCYVLRTSLKLYSPGEHLHSNSWWCCSENRTTVSINFRTELLSYESVWLPWAYSHVFIETEFIPDMDRHTTSNSGHRFGTRCLVEVELPLSPGNRVEWRWRKHCKSSAPFGRHIFHLEHKQTNESLMFTALHVLWNIVSYNKGGRQVKGNLKQNYETNIWVQKGSERGMEKASQWATS